MTLGNVLTPELARLGSSSSSVPSPSSGLVGGLDPECNRTPADHVSLIVRGWWASYDHSLAKLFMHISRLWITCNVILPSANTSSEWQLNIHAFLLEHFTVEDLCDIVPRTSPSLDSLRLLFSIFVSYFLFEAKQFLSSVVGHLTSSLVRGTFPLSTEGSEWRLKDGLMDRRFFLTFLLCSVSWIFFWEVRWKKGKESQIEEWLQGHSLSQYRHLFEGQWATVISI